MDEDLMDFVGYILIAIGYVTMTWILYTTLELITHKVYWDRNTRSLVLSLGLGFLLIGFYHLIKYLIK